MEETFFWQGAELSSLALSGFLSATLLPGSSEALLILSVNRGTVDPFWALWVVGLANTLGGLSTYFLGIWSVGQLVKRGKYRGPSTRAVELVGRWGIGALLFSWLPVIGDGLCFAAGWLKINWLGSLCAMLIGKILRYYVLIYWMLP
jgi:membrane protein YqaA with SNARE-associated domain